MSQEYLDERAVSGGQDVAAIISSYRRHLWLFVAVAIAVAAVVAGMLMIQPKMYTAKASVLLISPDRIQAQGDQGYKPGGDNSMIAYVETQTNALKSPELAGVVVDKLGLVRDPEFHSTATVETADVARQATIGSIVRHEKIRRVGQTYVAEVGFESRDPLKAARIANALATGFVDMQQQNKVAAARDANNLIEAQIEPLRQEVEHAEAAVASYKASHNLLSAEGSTLNEQEISTLTQQLALTRAAQAEADARLSTAKSQLRKGSSGEDIGEALSSPLIQDLRKQRAALVIKLAQLENHLGPRHPDMIATKQQLQDLDAEIHAEIGRIMSNLDAQAQVARERTQSVESSLAAARSSLATTNAASVQLNDLERDAQASRAVYEASLAKAKVTAQQQTVSQSDGQVSALAQPPLSPSAPNKPLDVLLGLMVGSAAGVAAVIARRLFDSTLRTQEDVETRLGAPYLAGIPTVVSSIENPKTKSPLDAVIKHPLSGFAEAFRSLGTAVNLSHGGGSQLIAITSSLPNEGKTTTSICLAEVLAIGGARVAVIDCDLRRRSVNAALKTNAKYGLLDVLRGQRSLDDAVHVDEISGVSYLLLPHNEPASARSPLDQPAFDDLLNQLRSRFDYVILDTPPLLPIVDTRKLATKVDAVILLARWEHTPRRAVQHSIRLLQDAGAPFNGVALTMVNLKAQQRYGYGDASYYYHGYSDYYLEGKT